VSFLTKKAPLWSLILAVLVTAGGFTSMIFVVPRLTADLQTLHDFSLAASPSSLTVTQGSFLTSNITVTSRGTFSGNVSLTVTAPMAVIGVAGGPSPGDLVAGGSATSVVSVEPSSLTTPGSYVVTVTGTAGVLTHSIDITVTVKASTIVNGQEDLSLDSSSFLNSTDAHLYLRNFGTVNITLVSYYAVDAYGDQWALVSWSGPSIAPNQVGVANILIGTSCPNCTYSGTAGAFTQFSPGSYSIKFVTTRNNQFTFTITR